MRCGKGSQSASIKDSKNCDVLKAQSGKLFNPIVMLSVFLLVCLFSSLSCADKDNAAKGSHALGQKSDTTTQNISNDGSGGPLEKIEPVLAQEYKSQAELNVIVYVQSPDLASISKPIKARYFQEINGYAEQIRALKNRNRAERSLAPDQERAPGDDQKIAMTTEEMAQLKALQKRHDAKRDEMKRELGLALQEAVRPNQETVANFIDAHGGVVTSRISAISAIGATIPSNLLMALANHSLVVRVMKDRPATLESGG